MSATRRQISRPTARKVQTASVTSGADATRLDARAIMTPEDAVDPVCADPAVVLWDEVRAPDQPSEEQAPERPATGTRNKALH